MFKLTLYYKGHFLPLFLHGKTFYSVKEFEPGKTLYHVLFEHLVDGVPVSQKGLARKYADKNEFLRDKVISKIMERIESAAKNSNDQELGKKHFVRLPAGGASPVLSRKSMDSRFTQQQNEIIKKTIQRLYCTGKIPSPKRIRIACLAALKKKDLAESVALSYPAIKRRIPRPPMQRK